VPEAFGTVCRGKFSDIYMKRGDIIRLETSGGGGYGDPRQRDPERVVHDVEEGFVSAEKAEQLYGYRVKNGKAERL
jgi:N-methylhydantoinase B